MARNRFPVWHDPNGPGWHTKGPGAFVFSSSRLDFAYYIEATPGI